MTLPWLCMADSGVFGFPSGVTQHVRRFGDGCGVVSSMSGEGHSYQLDERDKMAMVQSEQWKRLTGERKGSGGNRIGHLVDRDRPVRAGGQSGEVDGADLLLFYTGLSSLSSSPLPSSSLFTSRHHSIPLHLAN